MSDFYEMKIGDLEDQIKELEAEGEKIVDANIRLGMKNRELEADLKLAIEGLEKYGKLDNLVQISKGNTTHTRHQNDIETVSDCGYILKLKGKIARQTLAKIKNKQA